MKRNQKGRPVFSITKKNNNNRPVFPSSRHHQLIIYTWHLLALCWKIFQHNIKTTCKTLFLISHSFNIYVLQMYLLLYSKLSKMQSISADNSADGISCHKIEITNLRCPCHYHPVYQILMHKFGQSLFLLLQLNFQVLFNFSLKLYAFGNPQKDYNFKNVDLNST